MHRSHGTAAVQRPQVQALGLLHPARKLREPGLLTLNASLDAEHARAAAKHISFAGHTASVKAVQKSGLGYRTARLL